jgi:protein TonB
MDAPQRGLTLAFGFSLFLHAIVLSIHFKLPEALNRAREQALDVILVNSKSAHRPTDARARAQANLDGGGNTDEDRRIKTPLPVSKTTREGNDATATQRRVAELEAQTRAMMTQLRSEKALPTDNGRNDPTPLVPPNISGADLANQMLAIARLEGQIARQTEDYAKRPRKKFIGARTEEYRFAQYVEDWRQKVERIGNLNYPDAARGRFYGTLVLTVVIRNDGELDRIEVSRSSGQKVLDDAARRIVQLAAPYAAFPPDIRRDTDIIEITRTWSFTNADRLHTD